MRYASFALFLALFGVLLLAGCVSNGDTAAQSNQTNNSTAQTSTTSVVDRYYFGGPLKNASTICEDKTYIGTCNPNTYMRCGYDVYLKPTLVPDNSCRPNPFVNALFGPYGALAVIVVVVFLFWLYTEGHLQLPKKDQYLYGAKFGLFMNIEKAGLLYPFKGARLLDDKPVKLEDGRIEHVRRWSLRTNGNKPVEMVYDGDYEITIESLLKGQFGTIRRKRAGNNNYPRDIADLEYKLGGQRAMRNTEAATNDEQLRRMLSIFHQVRDDMAPIIQPGARFGMKSDRRQGESSGGADDG